MSITDAAGHAGAAEPAGVAGFDRMWAELAPVGRDPQTGGYRRHAWAAADLECREWFTATAQARDLEVETDGNGNLWAWWGSPEGEDAVVVGSHLDSVPDGGAFDGPLGVVSAFAAIDVLRSRGSKPRRPVAVVAFSDEEGARFGVACAGSRLLTGTLAADRALGLRADDGTTTAEAMAAAGHDPALVGPDPRRLARLGCVVELHVEQGRAPVDTPAGVVRGLGGAGRPLGVASAIWPHGRWRLDVTGRADHAGTTTLHDRDDPVLALATAVLAARRAAERHDALATFGKLRVIPNGVNAIASAATGWLDARGADEERVRALVTDVTADVTATATGAPPGASVTEESWTPATPFDPPLRDRLAHLLGDAPILATGAGHDAGVLATAGVASAMIFVRNPTGVSHSPAEHAETADCYAGVDALARVLEDLAWA